MDLQEFIDVVTVYDSGAWEACARPRRGPWSEWQLLVRGEWSDSPTNQGDVTLSLAQSTDRKHWILKESTSRPPRRRYIALATCAPDVPLVRIVRSMLDRLEIADHPLPDAYDERTALFDKVDALHWPGVLRSRLHTEAVESYLARVHRVLDPTGEFVLQVAVPSQALKELYPSRKRASALFATAYNPSPWPSLTPEQNATRHASLLSALGEKRWDWLPAQIEDPIGKGDPWAAVLILGLARDDADWAGRWLRQDLMLYAEQDAVPRLVTMS